MKTLVEQYADYISKQVGHDHIDEAFGDRALLKAKQDNHLYHAGEMVNKLRGTKSITGPNDLYVSRITDITGDLNNLHSRSTDSRGNINKNGSSTTYYGHAQGYDRPFAFTLSHHETPYSRGVPHKDVDLYKKHILEQTPNSHLTDAEAHEIASVVAPHHYKIASKFVPKLEGDKPERGRQRLASETILPEDPEYQK